MSTTRRTMLQLSAAATLAPLARASTSSSLHVASNQYSWQVYFKRDQKSFTEDWQAGLAAVAESGMSGFEAIASAPEAFAPMKPALKSNNLELRSIYVNSFLHEPEEARKSIESISAIADEAKKAGVRIIVTNPTPIRWGGDEAKDDTQLRTQAESMNALGKRLKEKGITLAYHFHDVEFLAGGREFHHMMVGTDPKQVTLCLDTHWVFRGTKDSAVALYDITRLYAHRVSELHLRQSIDGIWSETFSEGDIDYRIVSDILRENDIRPHVVLEQAVEQGTPHTMNSVEAHKISLDYVHTHFGWIA